MECTAEGNNRTDEEKNNSLAVQFNPVSPSPPVLPQHRLVFYPLENGTVHLPPFPVPYMDQSTLTPNVEPFCPGLQVYIPPSAIHNPPLPMTEIPDTTTSVIQPITGGIPHDFRDIQPITSVHRDIHQPITSPCYQTADVTSNFAPITTVQCPSVTSVTMESAPSPPTQERVAELERQLKEAARELTFMGDRNWRMEAYIDCLVHTLRKMDVTSVIDLNQKMLPLSLFHVKAKAGFQLGSFNQLPRRTVWSYSKDGVQPPNIDLSGTHVVRKQPIIKTDLLKELEANNLLPLEGDDIGLSIDQLFVYESRVMELERETYNLKERLQTASDKESILMERLRTSQQNANYLEEELNNRCEELNQAQFHIARLEQQNFRRYPRNPPFPGRFRPRHRHPPFSRPPLPYPPQPTMPFPPAPPVLAAGVPPPPPVFECGPQPPVSTYEDEAQDRTSVIPELPPNQPVYFISPPYPPPQLPPAMIEELPPNVDDGVEAQQTASVDQDVSSTTIDPVTASSS